MFKKRRKKHCNFNNGSVINCSNVSVDCDLVQSIGYSKAHIYILDISSTNV